MLQVRLVLMIYILPEIFDRFLLQKFVTGYVYIECGDFQECLWDSTTEFADA